MDRLEQLILKLLSEAVRLAETFLCGVFRAKRLEDGSEELLVLRVLWSAGWGRSSLRRYLDRYPRSAGA